MLRRTAVITALAALLLAPALVFAPAPRAAAQTPEPAAEAPAAEAPAAGAPAAGPSWLVSCTNSGEGGAMRCTMSQSVVLAASGQRLLTAEIQRRTDAEGAVMQVTLPHGLFLPAGVAMAVDGEALDPLVVQTCDPNGCYAGLAMPPELIARFEAGSGLAFAIEDLKRRRIEMTLRLDGFAEAWANLR